MKKRNYENNREIATDFGMHFVWDDFLCTSALALKRILGTKRFWAVFRKKNNELRIMRCDLKSRKSYFNEHGKRCRLKGNGQKSNLNEFLNVFDVHKKGYRTIPMARLKYIKKGKIRFLVEYSKSENAIVPTIRLNKLP